ncbi:MAG: hypothetical protein ACRERU_15245 [Methylococcales bacterium]
MVAAFEKHVLKASTPMIIKQLAPALNDNDRQRRIGAFRTLQDLDPRTIPPAFLKRLFEAATQEGDSVVRIQASQVIEHYQSQGFRFLKAPFWKRCLSFGGWRWIIRHTDELAG